LKHLYQIARCVGFMYPNINFISKGTHVLDVVTSTTKMKFLDNHPNNRRTSFCNDVLAFVAKCCNHVPMLKATTNLPLFSLSY
jgi:hypothetical protein